MSGGSSSVNLSSREKRAINDILSLAEEEIDKTETFKKIDTIDSQCKQVWPEWSPPKNSVLPSKLSSYKQSSKSQTSTKNQLQTSILKSKPSESTLENGSPKKNKNIRFEHDQPNGTKFSEQELDPQVIAQEIESLKKEVQGLMEKINRSIKSPELSPSALKILEQVKSIQMPPTLTRTTISQPSKRVDIPFKKEVIVSHHDVERLSLNNNNITNNNNNNQNNQQQNQQPKTLFIDQFQLPLKQRTKEQTKSAIAQVQREIKQITKENIALRKQYREIRKQLFESRNQCKALQNSISRSEAIRVKMINTFGIEAMTDEPEIVHKF